MRTGRIIGNKYCLLHELGRGGMGSVWAAEHLALRSRVAVKLIDATVREDDEAFLRFAQEARAAAALRSPHVVQVLDFGVDRAHPYLVMELLEGESLGDRIDRKGPLPAGDVWRVMSQVGRAMARAHARGFVHRDLKPDNLFLLDDEEEIVVKVLDFGVSKALEVAGVTRAPLTQAGAFLGTPQYVSPEQIQGFPADPRADLWSLGVIAFECLTGVMAFDAPTLPALIKRIFDDPPPVPSRFARVPAGFDAWFARAAAHDPAARFQSAKELVRSLRPVIGPEWDGEWTGMSRPRSLPPAGGADTLRLHTYPSWEVEKRSEVRFPSTIPTAIDGRRDLRHVALIYNVSRAGALLATRLAMSESQELRLTLHLEDAGRGDDVFARVVRAGPRSDPDDRLWKYEVGVRFLEPLSDALFARIEAHVAARRRPSR